jgi:hypothetical protein
MDRIETFYGDWSVEVLAINAGFSQRFKITGSNASDGFYLGTVGNAVPRVSGSQWTLSIEWSSDGGATWQSSGIRRSASYTIEEGMLVLLGADDNVPALRDGDFNDMILTCRYLNPVINPPPIPNPFDFTIPEHFVVRPNS